MRSLLEKGIDPSVHIAQSNRDKQITVADCINYWQEIYVHVSLRERTRKLYETTVIKHMKGAFPGVPIDEITVRQWVDLFTSEERINQRRAKELLVQLRSAINCMGTADRIHGGHYSQWHSRRNWLQLCCCQQSIYRTISLCSI